jgi:DNA-binding GntR family transcriptional regulator
MLNPFPRFIPECSDPLAEQLIEFLRNSIIEARFPGGYRLVESELQRRFGISRAPIRESFRVLEREGLLSSIPRKGTFVRLITKKDVEEHFPVRALLEGYAARLSCAHAKEKDIEAMELSFYRMTQAKEEKRYRDYLTYHSEYHDMLIRTCKNDTLIDMLVSLRRQAMWIVYLYRYIIESSEHELEIHRHILDLLISRNAAEIELLVRKHIEDALESFLRFSELESVSSEYPRSPTKSTQASR